MIVGGFFLLVSVVSWMLTGYLRRYALAQNLIDIPNERSSHSAPTPRGGGVAIVLSFLAMLLALNWIGWLPNSLCLALSGAGGVVAATGFLDDHGHIAARWRLLVHFSAAVWGLYWLGGLPPLIVFGAGLDLGWLGYVGAAVYIVWLLNLYNFMDGIDGLAGVEAVTVSCGAALCISLVVPDSNDWLLPTFLAAAVFGFLVWNFPPARIFMGDAGSGFLGIMLALLSLQSAWLAPRLLWVWLILLGVFIVDATVTLCRRVLRGEKFYQAHCSHAYQYASRCFGAHRSVTLAVCAINMFWLAPIAGLVALEALDGLVGLMAAYLPLLCLAYRYKAGARQPQVRRSAAD
ncbi:MAG: glycosyltransferase family 4 protein [Methylobacter sp.]|nr:glycosyltransferase family 4 protein [Methylobacter sp.]MDP2100315.1 glycosyltransferase family 4 protein [Methylobacter sp.]MDP2427117.1 glycosyltransferase family 4 protein [Methylobacter sp.]MDP3053672.1 glycosyltransferase family 4 protein [Methylobacter sp.]MDP3361077.1 glycosyltransferase family 4 protein [Methylobacter sp.]